MSKYIDILGAVSPTAKGAQHVADIVAALAPPPAAAPGASPAAIVKSEPAHPGITKSVMKFAPGVVGAGVGYYAWHKHPVLGAVGGHALASNAMALVKGDSDDRKMALCRLAVEGAAIYGALRHRRNPVLGFGVGMLAGAVVTAFVPGSPSREAWNYIKSQV